MAIDSLQEKIRKLKTPVIVDLGMTTKSIPQQYLEGASVAAAYKAYCDTLLEALKGNVAGVRFSFGAFSSMANAFCVAPKNIKKAIMAIYLFFNNVTSTIF